VAIDVVKFTQALGLQAPGRVRFRRTQRAK
jgi:hypothetical protein